MEKTLFGNPSKSLNDEEPNVSRKRRSEASEEPLITRLFRLPQHPSTSLRWDLNRQLPSNSVEVNSAPSIPGPGLLPPFLKEDDDQDSFPPYIREHINEIDQIIKQQGQQLTSMFANQQKNIYKMIMLTAEEKGGKKLKDITLELNMARLKILDMETIGGYLKGQIEKLQSNNQQLEGMVEHYKKQLELAVNSRENVEGSGYSTAQQQEDRDSSQVDANQAEMPRCKVCGKRLPTKILWPCHHLCLCMRCEINTKTCPCCGTTKICSSIVLFS